MPGKLNRMPLLALAGLVAVLTVLAPGVGASAETASSRPKPPTAAQVAAADRAFLSENSGASTSSTGGAGPGGGGTGPTGSVFPSYRYVGLYGSPALPRSAIGRRSVSGARSKLVSQASQYDGLGRPVVRGFDLISIVVTSTPGRNGRYARKESSSLIRSYYNSIHAIGGRLMVDIQPGRYSFLECVHKLSKWLAKPDVDLSYDPEWDVGSRGVPGKTPGFVTYKEVNAASSYVNKIRVANHLPPKVLVIHQFSRRMIRARSKIHQRAGLQVTLDFDGIGTRSAKTAGYAALHQNGLYNGMLVFYTLDKKPIMTPSQVVALQPVPDFVLYQ